MSERFFAYHLGVHGPLAPKMNNYFKKNQSQLEAGGIFTPRPDLYRPYCRDFIWGRGVYFKQQLEMLELIECPSDYRGICLSNNQALSPNDGIFQDGEFLFWTEPRVEKLGTIFADHRIVFVLEIENFATFIPRHLTGQKSEDLADIADWEVEDYSWFDVIDAIKAACPAAEIIVVPTEGMLHKFDEVAEAMTVRACSPRPFELQRLTKEQLDKFQTAIGASVGNPLDPDLEEDLKWSLGWTRDTRVALSRKYYSEVLELCHSTHIIL